MTDLEKLEYIHVTLQEMLNSNSVSYGDDEDAILYEIETSLEFVEELREPHFKEKKEWKYIATWMGG